MPLAFPGLWQAIRLWPPSLGNPFCHRVSTQTAQDKIIAARADDLQPGYSLRRDVKGGALACSASASYQKE